MITIIDFGMGNLRSVQKAFERISVPVVITSSSGDVASAKKLILPGVGHFARAMKTLSAAGLDTAIKHAVVDKNIPILGICLGMQLLTAYSEEGHVSGLGLIDAETKQFNGLSGLKIPHMGWNAIKPRKPSSLHDGLSVEDPFYFVHSYYVTCNYPQDRLFQTDYGNSFDSGFQRGHIAGVQFHPEKSHKAGLLLLNNFAKSGQ